MTVPWQRSQSLKWKFTCQNSWIDLTKRRKHLFFCHTNRNSHSRNCVLLTFQNRSVREPRLVFVSGWSFLQPKLLKNPLIISTPADRLTPDLTPQRWTPQFPPSWWVFGKDSRCSALNLENLPQPVSLFSVRQTCQPSCSTLPRLSVEHASPFSATVSWIPRALKHQSRKRPCLIPQTVH